jgi:hypothetical protein
MSQSTLRPLLWMALATMALTGLTLAGCEQIDKVTDFVQSISDGAPCKENYQCWGQRCLKEAQGFPGGYCTTLSCEEKGCSGFASECFRTELEGQPITACFEQCQADNTCRRAAEGYQCAILQDTAVCVPPSFADGPAPGSIGAPCSADIQCGEGGTCLTNSFGGYCTRLSCSSSNACPDGNSCVALNPDETDEDKRIYGCLLKCSTDSDCRFRYSCQDFGGQRVCLESDRVVEARNPDGLDDGEPCVANINCKGGTCIREVENSAGDISFPDGYCTTRQCSGDQDCNGDGICISRERYTTCMQPCSSNRDCRDGYQCREGLEGRSFCDSKIAYVPLDTSGEKAFDIQCVNGRSFSFDIPSGAVGFYVAPFTRAGAPLKPTTLSKPDNSTLNIERDYKFHAVNPSILPGLAPILFPASDAPEFANAFGPGRYTMQVQTDAAEVCYYVIPKMAPGRTLDVNLYFVGVPGVTAATAPQSRDMQQVIASMREIYQTMGVTVNIARYIEADRQVTEMYSILRDFNDIFALVATSEAPGTTAEENLSVNAFLINDFNIADAKGLLGVSAGLPGMAGLHGNSGSGLIFSTVNLGKDNANLGQVMAHEIGHFLGLRHTTEHLGSAHDPITDTPTCLIPQLGYFCPDAKNFMFAFSLGSDQRQTTRGQAFVVQRSPLVK